jgi:AraC family transcriptional regulator, arabinose operon regulatory protein
MIIMVKVHYNAELYSRNYRPLSDRLSINAYGIQEPMPPGMVTRPNGTGDFLFMFFYDPMEVLVRGVLQSLPKSSIMVWQPKSQHFYGNRHQGYLHSWMHFDGSLARSLVRQSGIVLDEPILRAHRGHFERFIEALHEEIASYKHPDRRIVENCVRNFIYGITHFVRMSEEQGVIPERILKVRNFLDLEFRSEIRLTELARIASLSVPHLSAEFKRYVGAAPIEYLIQVRLSRAVNLITGSTLRIGEIAEMVGIPDVYYFSKLFKQRHGRSPLKMRKQC